MTAGALYDRLDKRLQARHRQLVRERCHVLTGVTNGLSALPGTAQPFAATWAMHRFLTNPAVTLPALVEPAQERVRAAVADSRGAVALIAHDWSSLHVHDTGRKKDLYQRTHAHDTGYELAAAQVVDSHTGRPLGPMELRLRTADGVLSTRPTRPPPRPVTCTNCWTP